MSKLTTVRISGRGQSVYGCVAVGTSSMAMERKPMITRSTVSNCS